MLRLLCLRYLVPFSLPLDIQEFGGTGVVCGMNSKYDGNRNKKIGRARRKGSALKKRG